MRHWHAGWHMPGYSPETPYETFDGDDHASAVAYVAAEIDRLDDIDGWTDAHTAWHNNAADPNGYSVDLDRCTYEVYPCARPACAHDDDPMEH